MNSFSKFGRKVCINKGLLSLNQNKLFNATLISWLVKSHQNMKKPLTQFSLQHMPLPCMWGTVILMWMNL